MYQTTPRGVGILREKDPIGMYFVELYMLNQYKIQSEGSKDNSFEEKHQQRVKEITGG